MNKQSTIIVGLQWGDEGKGKIIDAIAKGFDYVARWNGGNNAGHTIEVDGVRFALSLVPSGVIQKRKLLIAQGVVVNPKVLLDEIAMLSSHGYNVDLLIDPRCHVVMPYHQEIDRANEQWKGKAATGSLHLGIGYCYEDRNNRSGIRMEDLIRPTILSQKIIALLPLKIAILRHVYGVQTSLDAKKIIREYVRYGSALRQYIGDVSSLVSKKISHSRILFEQAHGTMLDPVFGTYPYTVAPYTISSAMFPSVGIPARPMRVLGVVKAYTTRVGNGPFPTELTNAIGVFIRTQGHEFGTVSKRPRRCGWLDLAILRYAIRLNGVQEIAQTKLDVLSGLKVIKICTGYRYKHMILREFPDSINILPHCRPIYDTLPGWQKSLRSIKHRSQLPKEAKRYLAFIEHQLGVPIRMISVGPDRKELITI